MASVIPAPGNRTLVSMVKIAKQHDLKMIIPASIWINRDRNAFMYNDMQTGSCKIKQNQLIDANVLNSFISTYMTPQTEDDLSQKQFQQPLYALKRMCRVKNDGVYSDSDVMLFYDK